jgi:hypothetical protein
VVINNPDKVNKCREADTTKFKSHGDTLFIGGIDIGIHTPGNITNPFTVIIFFTAPGVGIVGGVLDKVAPTQYA